MPDGPGTYKKKKGRPKKFKGFSGISGKTVASTLTKKKKVDKNKKGGSEKCK